MKIAFIVFNDYFNKDLMQYLGEAGIDYYTRWDDVKGKGHGTAAHLGKGSTPSMNTVFMIAFPEEGPLEALIQKITTVNAGVTRADDRIRLFQMPLDRIV